jgi:pyrroline-5-carboxylate reductase
MSQLRVGIFGCGNMGRALALGMRAHFDELQFTFYTPSGVKAEQLAQEVGGRVVQNLSDMPKDLDWYVLAFKPQSLSEFHFDFLPDSKVISVLAGVNTRSLTGQLGISKLVRLMPNTPSSVGKGANLYFTNEFISTEEESVLLNLLFGTGKLFKMSSEEDLDLCTAFSGSGPALLFELARIFEEELTHMTKARVPAKEIIAQTFLGSAELMQSKASFEELRNQVTSKKGVTFEALEVLNEFHLQSLFQKAFMAAYKRTLELSK